MTVEGQVLLARCEAARTVAAQSWGRHLFAVRADRGPVLAAAQYTGQADYATGDDFSHVDWQRAARLDELVSRQNRGVETGTVELLLDTSRSMAIGTPSKFSLAQQLAVALGYLALSAGRKVHVPGASARVPRAGGVRMPGASASPPQNDWGGAPLAPGTSAPDTLTPGTLSPGTPTPGTPSLGTQNSATFSSVTQAYCLFDTVQQLHPTTDADSLGTSVAQAARRLRRGDLTVVFSDLLHPQGIARLAAPFARPAEQLLLLQVLAPEDLEPTWLDGVALRDVQSGGNLNLDLAEEDLARYRSAAADFCRTIRRHCQARGIRIVQLRSDTDFDRALEYIIHVLAIPSSARH